MIKPLRKRHLQIWVLWAVLIPIGIISAVLVRPAFPKDKLLQPASIAALPIVLKTYGNNNFTINIRSNADSSQAQLEWINKKISTYPTTTIYQDTTNTNDISKSVLIGRIEARGAYLFNLKTGYTHYHFIVYDFIHNQIIDSVKL